MLIPKRFFACRWACVLALRSTQIKTSGGSRDTDENAFAVMADGNNRHPGGETSHRFAKFRRIQCHRQTLVIPNRSAGPVRNSLSSLYSALIRPHYHALPLYDSI